MLDERDPGDVGVSVIEWPLGGDPVIRRQVRNPDNHLFEVSQLT